MYRVRGCVYIRWTRDDGETRAAGVRENDGEGRKFGAEGLRENVHELRNKICKKRYRTI